MEIFHSMTAARIMFSKSKGGLLTVKMRKMIVAFTHRYEYFIRSILFFSY